MTPSQAAQEKPTSPVGDRYRLHLGGPVALAARCPHCNHRVIVEEREAAAATPSLDGLEAEIAEIVAAELPRTASRQATTT